MQSAPDGSSKTIVDPKASAQPAGTDKAAKDSVPPSDGLSPKQVGLARRSRAAKFEGTAKDEKASFDKGTLTSPGAPKDVDTAPAKFSDRNTADDALPIAGYTLKHLTDDQRRAISASVRSEKTTRTEPAGGTDFATVGALVPTAIALTGLRPLPESVVSNIPELRSVMFARSGDKLVLINPRTLVVIGVLTS